MSGTAQMEWFAQSGKVNWSTPDEELELVRRVSLDGAIGLDPCSNPFAEPIVRARRCCMLERGENGLALDWRGYGVTYFNAPYGVGEVDLFTAKAAKHFGGEPRAPLGADQCIGLVPANPETKWCHRDLVRQADATCFREGRIGFLDPATGKPCREATVKNLWAYFGDHVERFFAVYAGEGDCRLTHIGARRLVARGRADLVLQLAQGLIDGAREIDLAVRA